jgi:cytochrome c
LIRFQEIPMKATTLKSRSTRLLTALLAGGAVAAALTHAMPARADAALGKTGFAACAACHSVTGADGIGPHLNGVVGRKAGSVAGFNYSPAMKRSNTVWNDQALAAYLADPQQAVPGNRMPFSGLQDPKQVADIVDYLKSLH